MAVLFVFTLDSVYVGIPDPRPLYTNRTLVWSTYPWQFCLCSLLYLPRDPWPPPADQRNSRTPGSRYSGPTCRWDGSCRRWVVPQSPSSQSVLYFLHQVPSLCICLKQEIHKTYCHKLSIIWTASRKKGPKGISEHECSCIPLTCTNTYTYDFMYYTSLFIITRLNSLPSCCFIIS